MAPTPKRRHSTYRKGKRMAARTVELNNLVKDPITGEAKLPHRQPSKLKF
jgi:ribosomal protein L32